MTYEATTLARFTERHIHRLNDVGFDNGLINGVASTELTDIAQGQQAFVSARLRWEGLVISDKDVVFIYGAVFLVRGLATSMAILRYLRTRARSFANRPRQARHGPSQSTAQL